MPRVHRRIVILDLLTGIAHSFVPEMCPGQDNMPGDVPCGASFFWVTATVSLPENTKYFFASIATGVETCIGCLAET